MADFLGRSFEPIQDGVFARSRFLGASAALEILDEIFLATLAIPDNGVDMLIGDPEIVTSRVGVEAALRVDALLGTADPFDLVPGDGQ